MNKIFDLLVSMTAFRAEYRFAKGGLSGSAQGEVRVEVSAENQLIFHEAGVFTQAHGMQHSVNNVYRWSVRDESIFLEHLRASQAEPLARFDLQGLPPYVAAPYHCGPDCYQATLNPSDGKIKLQWQIQGERKQGLILTGYA